jgi:hypothetical protein
MTYNRKCTIEECDNFIGYAYSKYCHQCWDGVIERNIKAISEAHKRPKQSD